MRGKRSTRTPKAADKSPPFRLNLAIWHKGVLILLLVAMGLGWLAWLCTRDPKINFLSRKGQAEWILFSRAMDASAHRITNLDTVFRREFILDAQPQAARVRMRAAKRAELKINGTPVELPADRNWKNGADVEVAAYLRAGDNSIESRVFNDNAPSALWVILTADRFTLGSDATWEASCTGSAWRPAALARIPRLPRAGNIMAGGEEVVSALRNVWIRWLIFAGLAVLLCAAGKLWLVGSHDLSRRHVVILLLAIASLWLFLFANNARLMPFLHGFDSQDHLNYIKYVQERHALPLPTEGFEMFQPPLYYVVSAVVLSLCGLAADAPAGILVLRFLTMIFGVLQFVFVFLSVRLIFSGRVGAPLVGLGLAAFLPMQLYLSHYVTNETLAATLVTMSLYLGLRLLRTEYPSVSQFAWLGLCLGAAMLTKATALLLVGPLFLALVIRLAVQREPAAIWVRHFGTVSAVFLATCGWHYLRIWRRFGTPLVGNWDAAAGFPWWQDPGFHTAVDYARFGQSLVAPLFSGFWSFADGIYSTFWGDALAGGVPNLAFRPPWNYDLMVAGYLPALVLTLVILAGAAVAFARFVRKPSLEWFVLFGLTGAVMFGLIVMTLKVASYAQVKAFYGLATLVPLCAFGAVGWEVLTRGHRMLQSVLAALLLFFAINSFASYWIVRSAAQQVYAGARLGLEGKLDVALAAATQAINSAPADATARRLRASLFSDSGRASEALSEAQRAVELSPMDGACHLQLGMVLARQGQVESAIAETRRAIELGPENLSARNFLLVCLSKSDRGEEVISGAREGLAVFPFSFELQHAVGVALAKKGDFGAAARHFAYALRLRPELTQVRANLHLALRFIAKSSDAWQRIREETVLASDDPVILNEVAWFFATQPDARLRNGAEAARLAERASALTGRVDLGMLTTLAAAYAELGRFPEAIDLAAETRRRAQSSGDANTTKLTDKLLAAFQIGRAYREEEPAQR